MIKPIIVSMGLLGLSLTPALTAADSRLPEESAVRAIVKEFETAWNRHDMNEFAALFATDADFVNVIGQRWVGRDAIRKAHAANHATIFKTSTLEVGDTTVRFLKPDVAVARSIWTLSGETDNGRAVPARTGILTHVLVKADGHWLIVVSQNTDIEETDG